MKKYIIVIISAFIFTFGGFLPIAFADDSTSDIVILQGQIAELLIQIESLQETFLDLTGQSSIPDVEPSEIKDTTGTKLNQKVSIEYIVNVIKLLDNDPEFLSRSYNRIFWSND